MKSEGGRVKSERGTSLSARQMNDAAALRRRRVVLPVARAAGYDFATGGSVVAEVGAVVAGGGTVVTLARFPPRRTTVFMFAT